MDHAGHNRILPDSSLWEALVAMSSDGVVITDANDRITLINPTATRLLDIQGDSPVGRHITDILPLTSHDDDDDDTQIIIGDDVYTLCRTTRGDQDTMLLIQPTQHTNDVVRQLHREQQLRQLTMDVSSALDIDTILERVAQMSMELIDADSGTLSLYNSDHDYLLTTRIINLPPSSIPSPLYRGSGVIWDLIDTGRSAIINNYQHEPKALPSLIALGVRVVIAVPVRISNQILGAISLYRVTPGRMFSRHDRELLEMIGLQTGIALQNARLYEEAIHESRRRHKLYAASVEIGAALDMEDLYQAIHRAACHMLVCDSFAIALYDKQSQEVAYVYTVDHQGRWPARRVPLGHGLLGHVIHTDTSLRLSNSDTEIERIFGVGTHSDIAMSRSILATVMHTGDQIVGAITVQSQAPFAYTSKDLDALEMLASTAAIATQNAHLFARIQKMATIDPLTQIPNRRHFFEIASHEIERANRYKRPMSLVIFDIDRFKAVNDTYGHIAGDHVLKTVAARCRYELRDTDTVARYGGEEFVMLMPETSYAQALLVVERLRVCISEAPVESDVGPIPISVSLGFDSCDEMFAGSLEKLLDRADQALYVAKRGGRNRVIGFRSLVFGHDGIGQPHAS